jgi:hypothetical protein
MCVVRRNYEPYGSIISAAMLSGWVGGVAHGLSKPGESVTPSAHRFRAAITQTKNIYRFIIDRDFRPVFFNYLHKPQGTLRQFKIDKKRTALYAC